MPIFGALRTLFSRTGLLIIIYIVIGVLVNTSSPHVPTVSLQSPAFLHTWVQYFVSVLLWPLSFWHPVFTVGKWHG